MPGLNGRRVFITGGARGIGFALAQAVAAAGGTPIIADIDAEASSDAASRIGRGSVGYGLDVTDATAFESVLSRAAEEVGPIDVVVNNAGIAEASPRIVDQDPQLIERILDVNLKGTINGTIAAIRQLERTGGGQVINVASQAGKTGVPALAIYSASKFGVLGFTDAVRLEYRGSNIVLTCVMPGPASTEMMAGTRKVPLIKLVEPSQVAAAIVEAIEKRREEVFVPKSTGYLVRLTAMLPVRFRERISKLSGIDRVYAEIDPQARAAYSGRVDPQIDQDE